MRIILVGWLGVGILLIALLAVKSTPRNTPSRYSYTPTPTVRPAPPPQTLDIIKDETSYRIAWTLVPNASAITLIPNFTQKRTAASLIDNTECNTVTNGGFYTPDNLPTGLFITQGKVLHRALPNALFNGYVAIDEKNVASIFPSPPVDPVRLALQSGPILVVDGSPIKFTIHDDESARRVGFAVTNNESVVFFTVYNPENTWSGPKLAEMPTLLTPLITRLGIIDAVNLDGGSASAFIRDDFSLQELTSVGSFFCIR